MTERAQSLGGSVELKPGEQGGAVLRLQLPLAQVAT
jgi:signal transduction histidine kinase